MWFLAYNSEQVKRTEWHHLDKSFTYYLWTGLLYKKISKNNYCQLISYSNNKYPTNSIKNYTHTHSHENLGKAWNGQRLLGAPYNRNTLSHAISGWSYFTTCKLKKLCDSANDSWPQEYEYVMSELLEIQITTALWVLTDFDPSVKSTFLVTSVCVYLCVTLFWAHGH